MDYQIKPFGQSALLIEFSSEISEQTSALVNEAYRYIQKKPQWGVVSLIPAYTSLTVCFHPLMTTYEKLSKLIRQLLDGLNQAKLPEGELKLIPVCYSIGLDIELVLKELEITIEELVDLHSSKTYRVDFLGFMPGFAYLQGLHEKLFIPRKSVPRVKIPKGAVALGGGQTGIYPFESPGGWQIIGQTPLEMFSENGAFCQVNDRVRFVPITESEFLSIQRNGKS